MILLYTDKSKEIKYHQLRSVPYSIQVSYVFSLLNNSNVNHVFKCLACEKMKSSIRWHWKTKVVCIKYVRRKVGCWIGEVHLYCSML